MNKQWFVLHTLTGQERKTLEMIEQRIKLERMEDFFGRVIVPIEKVVEKKNGKKSTHTRLVMPGYVFCEMALYDESRDVDEMGKKPIHVRVWQFLRETNGVIGFVGMNPRDPYPQPIPLKPSEINPILTNGRGTNPNAGADVPVIKVNFAVDEAVKITDGAFMGLTGQVSMVDPDKGKLKVEVQVFGRKVPVDVEYWQVEKVAIEETLEPLK